MLSHPKTPVAWELLHPDGVSLILLIFRAIQLDSAPRIAGRLDFVFLVFRAYFLFQRSVSLRLLVSGPVSLHEVFSGEDRSITGVKT